MNTDQTCIPCGLPWGIHSTPEVCMYYIVLLQPMHDHGYNSDNSTNYYYILPHC